MKKIITLVCICLCLFSCGGESGVNRVMPEFDADIFIICDGGEYRAVYEKRIGTDRLRICEPSYLSGLEFELCDGVTNVMYGDLRFETEAFSAVFDFLPVECDTVKKAGNREYRIDIREP